MTRAAHSSPPLHPRHCLRTGTVGHFKALTRHFVCVCVCVCGRGPRLMNDFTLPTTSSLFSHSNSRQQQRLHFSPTLTSSSSFLSLSIYLALPPLVQPCAHSDCVCVGLVFQHALLVFSFVFCFSLFRFFLFLLRAPSFLAFCFASSAASSLVTAVRYFIFPFASCFRASFA